MARTECLVYEGLGNRINGLVSALLTGREVDVAWSVNQHCPVRFEQLFFPVTGLHVQNVDEESFPYVHEADRICCRFLLNVSGLDVETFQREAKKHYRNILGQLKHRADFEMPELSAGVHYRAYFAADQAEQLERFILQLEAWLDRKDPACVFVASDNHDAKKRIRSTIDRWGYPTVAVECPLLVTGDFDRSLENLIGMSKEMVCFSQCSRGILSNSVQSSVCDSARGFDVVVDRLFDIDFEQRDHDLEAWVNKPLGLKDQGSTS